MKQMNLGNRRFSLIKNFAMRNQIVSVDYTNGQEQGVQGSQKD